MKARNLFALIFAFILITVLASGAAFSAGKQKKFSVIDLDPTAMELRDKMTENPKDACPMSEYAAYCAKKGWYDEALKHYKKASTIKKNDQALWVNIGSIYVRMGRGSSAASAFKKAISIDPNYAIAHYNLGSIYDANHNYEAAIREYKRALILDPGLANPSANPLIVNNTLLTVLAMLIYKDKEGALSLPLQEICGK